MVYYILSFLIFVLGLSSFSEKNKKDTSIAYIIAVSLLVLIAGLKTQGSTDYLSYKNVYETFSTNVSFESSYEIGFQLFQNTFRILGLGFLFFYFVFACVSIGVKTYVIKKMVPYVFPALMIYLCGLYFERDNDGIRQGISIAFCYIGMYYMLRDKKVKMIISYLLAISFHYSSAVFAITFVLGKVKLKDRTIAIVVGIFFILCAVHLSFSNILMNYLPSEVALLKMEQYSNSEDYSVAMGITVGLIFRMIILLLFMFLHHKMQISEKLYLILRNGFALSIILSLAFNDFIILAHRLPYAFREFQIFIVPYMFTAARRTDQKQFFYFVLWIYCCVILYRFLNGDGAAVYNSYSNYIFDLLSM